MDVSGRSETTEHHGGDGDNGDDRFTNGDDVETTLRTNSNRTTKPAKQKPMLVSLTGVGSVVVASGGSNDDEDDDDDDDEDEDDRDDKAKGEAKKASSSLLRDVSVASSPSLLPSLPAANLVGGKASSLARLYRLTGEKKTTTTTKMITTTTKKDTKKKKTLEGSEVCPEERATFAVPPNAYALTTEFFRKWADAVVATREWSELNEALMSPDRRLRRSDGDGVGAPAVEHLCEALKAMCLSLPLGADQERALDEIRDKMGTWPAPRRPCRAATSVDSIDHNTVRDGDADNGDGGDDNRCHLPPLAAVRSSAPEEDGCASSYAGTYETILGVSERDLESAVRRCFASRFDHRALIYSAAVDDLPSGGGVGGLGEKVAFAVVVMEMVDADVAGVAFTANPINSDLDEMVVDCSWGLGETVVDGSVDVDHYVWDKVGSKIVEEKIGDKKWERRLGRGGDRDGNGVGLGFVETRAVDGSRRTEKTLTARQLKELAELAGAIESEYGMPMDIEWAYRHKYDEDGRDVGPIWTVLQARPITTLFRLDERMITPPGERRVLYYDLHVASEATTMNPFTHMDLCLCSRMSAIILGIPDIRMVSDDPRMFFINGRTRQYGNLSIAFRFVSTKFYAKYTRTLDPYLSDIFSSSDCDRKKYRIKKLPKEFNVRNAAHYARKIPFWQVYKVRRSYESDPVKSKRRYISTYSKDFARFKALESRGMIREEGIWRYLEEVIGAFRPSLREEMGAIMCILSIFHELDTKRREGKTEAERGEYDALCGGFVGDELMAMNIEMYRLANKLPSSIWDEYGHDGLPDLANRIVANLDGVASDLPQEFIDGWREFMVDFGFDGQDQLFVSSERYVDSPVSLLARLRHNVGDNIKDPTIMQHEQLAKRREVMALHERNAARRCVRNPLALSKIRRRNMILDHVFWMRNCFKIHISRAVAAARSALLKVQDEFIRDGRLDRNGDIFHLSPDEVDAALLDPTYELMSLVRPRREIYDRATRANECPMLIDSRCRILRPDPPSSLPGKGGDKRKGKDKDGLGCDADGADADSDGTVLIGSAVSPGVATGRVRIVRKPTDRFENGEVLATRVTSPAWTPLFVGASAVVLQVGGVLQHGALCAREYGKPAVSSVDVMSNLKTGMLVRVDGNSGVVRILESGNNDGGSGKVRV